MIPRKPVGQRMVGPLAARGRDATEEADLAEALRRSRLTAKREKRKRAAAAHSSPLRLLASLRSSPAPETPWSIWYMLASSTLSCSSASELLRVLYWI